MSEQITIRKAVPGDGPALQQLNQEDLGYQVSEEDLQSQLQKILQLPTHQILIAEKSKKAVGYIHLQNYDTLYSQPLLNILGLAVAGASRRQGVGRTLLQAAESWAKEQDCCGIRLNSGSERLAAHQFYQANGYQLRKEQKNFLKYWE